MTTGNYSIKNSSADSLRSSDSERSLSSDEYLTEFEEPVRV